MADGGKKFCHNPPPHEGVWQWFYQAAQDIDWRAVGLTHVEYPVGDLVGKGLAWISLTPIFLVVSFVTLIIFRRELHTITFFIGILLSEGFNLVLKYSIKAPRPCRASTMYDVVYGMPSSHAQFMAFFSSYIVLFAFVRLHNQYESRMDIIWKYAVSSGSVAVALVVSYSRIYLRYHTVEQVFYGLLVGFILGILWFVFTQRVLSPSFDIIVSWQRQRKLVKPN